MKFTTLSVLLLAAAPTVFANPRPKQANQTPAFDKRQPEILKQRQVTKTNTNDTPNHTSSTVSVGGPGPADGLTPCILDCVKAAAKDAQCPSYLDLPCICTSAPFLASASSCLKSKCTPAEQQQALSLQAQQCGAIGSVTLTSSTRGGASSTPTAPTGSITGSATTQGTEPTTGSATSSGAAQTTSNAARAIGAPGYGSADFGKWIVVSLGVVAGAWVVA